MNYIDKVKIKSKKTPPMKTAWRLTLFTLILLLSIWGAMRLRWETDLTGVLPDKIAQIQAVKSFNQYFKDDRQVVVWIQAKEDKVYEGDVEELAGFLESTLPCQISYDSSSGQDHDKFIKDLAEVWVLSKPEIVDEFITNLQNDDLQRNNLLELKDTIRRSLQSGNVTRQSYDPFGFMLHPGLQTLSNGDDYSFLSDDEKSRFFFVKNLKNNSSESYIDDKEWVETLRHKMSEWNTEYDDSFTFQLTGGPVYNSEIGAGMQKDLLGTIAGLLFLILQRSFLQLIVLISLVGLTFFITLGIMGLIMPSLSVLSVGFAAILLGLVIDYAIVILREAQQFDQDRKAIRSGLQKSILWAAMTTGLVFSILMLSSFPGVKQLGLLILIGLTVGALIMIYGIPWYLEKFPTKQKILFSSKARKGNRSLILPLLLILMGIGVFLLKGTPDFNFSLHNLQPSGGEASTVQKELTQRFSSWSDLNTTIFSHAESSEALEKKISIAEQAANGLVKDGVLTNSRLPSALIPYPSAYERNHAKLSTLLDNWVRLEALATEAGFTREATKHNYSIIKTIAELPNTYDHMQLQGRKNNITDRIFATDNDTIYFRGGITLSKPLTPESLNNMRELNSEGVVMTGWGTLSTALEPLVKKDFKTIFLPAVGVILLALTFVFRNLKESFLVFIVLITSLITVNSIMVLVEIPWNFLNVIAFPLIVGVGIDYSIHLIFALRRHGESSIWRGVGLAITFCGISSFVGFGSLNFAQNEVLRSLGLVCSIGVIVTMFLSLLVIPPVWRKWCGNSQNT